MPKRKLIQAPDRINNKPSEDKKAQLNQLGAMFSELLAIKTDLDNFHAQMQGSQELKSNIKYIQDRVNELKKRLDGIDSMIGELPSQQSVASLQEDLTILRRDIEGLSSSEKADKSLAGLQDKLKFILSKEPDIRKVIESQHEQNTDIALGVQVKDLNMGGHKIVNHEGGDLATKDFVNESMTRAIAVTDRGKKGGGGGIGRYGTPADGEYGRWNRDRLEGRTVAQVKSDLSLEDSDINALIAATKLDDLAAPDDNNDLNASVSSHGLLLKLENTTTKYLRDDGTWQAIAGGGDMLKSTYDPDGNGVIAAAQLDSDVLTATEHTALGDGAPHHTKYTDAEAVTAAKTVKLDDFTAPDDNTDLDGSAAKHGLYPKADASKLAGVEASAVALATVKADADIADAITKKHSQNTDTDLDATFEAALKNTDNHTSGSTNKVYTATEQTKLSGIETGADVTGSHAPQAHKDSHDPNDGSDPLDTANPAELAGVQAAGTGTSHSLARADHAHQIQAAITDDHLLTVDDASAADDDFARFTANGIEGIPVATAIAALLAPALPENTLILLDPALSADAKYSGIAMTGTAGAILAYGEAVYLAVADSKWEKAKGDAEATIAPMTGIVVVAAAENATVTVLILGHIREDDWNFTVGAPVFISAATAGVLTTTELTTGQYQKCIGWAVTADSIMVVPQANWVKVG